MEQSLMDKLTILADSAKYDVACTSSGASHPAKRGTIGSCYAPGCCHAFTADGRCVSLLKVLMSNCCAFDCSYCVNTRFYTIYIVYRILLFHTRVQAVVRAASAARSASASSG